MDIFKIGGYRLFLSESGRVQYVEIYEIYSTYLEKLVPLITREISRYKKHRI